MYMDWIQIPLDDLAEVISREAQLGDDWAERIAAQYIEEVRVATGLIPVPGLHDALAKKLLALVGSNHQVLAAWGESITKKKH